MENHPHSRPQIKLSKQRYNGGNKFAATSIYDDVFGGPPSFGVPNLSPRPEDYYEIFGGFHASRPTSIPVLDLPLGDEEDEVDYDVRGCDYGEVFGGVGGLDFASSVDELLNQSSGGGRDLDCGGVNVDDSSDGAWTPTETESISGESDHFQKRQCSSNGDSYELIGSSTEFSLSYHKVDCGSGDLFSGVTHIAQPNVPEYDCVVDEIRPVRKLGNMKQPVYACDDDIFDLGGKTMQGDGIRETLSHSTESTAGLKTFVSGFGSDRRYGEVGPTDDEMFVSISEISLRTQPSEVPPPSRPPPVLDCKRKDYENCQTTASRGSFGSSSSSSQSPPYFDVEIDSGSAAVASSLAVKEATDKAWGKVKAKEVFERKREGGQTSTRPGLKHDANDKKEHWSKVADVSRSVIDERVQGSSREEDGAMEPSIRQEKQARNATRAVSNSRGSEKAFTTAKISVEEKHGKNYLSSQGSDKFDVADELQEAAEFFDLVRTDGSKMAFVEVSKETLKQRDDSHCKEEAVREDHQLDKVFKHFEAAKEACEKGGSMAGSEAVKGAHRHKEHKKKEKVARVVGKQEEDEAKFRMVRPIDTVKKPTEEEESQNNEKQLEKDGNKHMENQKRYKEFQETKDDEKMGQVHEQAETEKTIEVAPEEEDDKDYSLTQNFELEESEEKDADELDEGEMIWRMALEQLENEKKLKQALELDERQKKGRQACPKEVNEKISEQVLESENNKKKQVYGKEEVEKKVEQDFHDGKPLQEAFELEDVSIKEALDGEDELKMKHTQEREENETLKGVNRVRDKFVQKQEEGNDRFVRPPPAQESAETRRKRELAQSSLCEAKENSRKTAQPVKPSQTTERMDKNDGESLIANEKKTTRMRRKIERENKLVRKIDEERETEKDRIGVDKVALEAHERVERAPMERATAEARDCAAENATDEEARERLERSVSDYFSTSSRNSGMGTSSSSSGLQIQQLQTTVSFYCSSYPSDNNGIEGEPALRCKARLERYRRISERAAKALAEKHTLDLLAQKEQAERNRLADTLDAEVKRWSNGKERNLRALLSTLQYILGPDSGWHPVPLTEVITSAAVKKAYRKATLCVHPDKLQQRNASIQQKYISEKVYYLLKEAWNRYNSEEW